MRSFAALPFYLMRGALQGDRNKQERRRIAALQRATTKQGRTRSSLRPHVAGVTGVRLPQPHLADREALAGGVVEDQPGDVLRGRVDLHDEDRLALLAQQRQ